MNDNDLNLFTFIVAIIGLAVGIFAFLWEFVYQPRKRIGYRVQMDTPVRGKPRLDAEYLGVLENLLPESEGPQEGVGSISMVLLKIENAGLTYISRGDYQSSSLVVRFRKREVLGVAVTDVEPGSLADDLQQNNKITTGLDGDDGVVRVPPVGLRRDNHYKIMAVLKRRAEAATGDKPVDVEVQVSERSPKETKSRTRPSPWYALLTLAIVVLFVSQLIVVSIRSPRPEDCAAGELTLLGSSAFGPTLIAAGTEYEKRCTGAHFSYQFQDSDEGLYTLAQQRHQDMLSFSDGKGAAGPELASPRPIAFTLFTLIVDKDFDISNLTSQQIKDLFAGRVADWDQIRPGLHQPVRLVGRDPGSGTESAFEQQVLDRHAPMQRNTIRCATGGEPVAAGYPLSCELPLTADVLNAVRSTPGAIGYVGVDTAAEDSDVKAVTIDGVQATRLEEVNGAYRFGATEYAYNYGTAQPPHDSLAASFLRYLGYLGGKDIVNDHHSVPCGELARPISCTPY